MKHRRRFGDVFRLTNLGMVVALALIAGATVVVGDFLLGMVDVFTAEGVVYVVVIVLSGGLLLSLASLCVALDNAMRLGRPVGSTRPDSTMRASSGDGWPDGAPAPPEPGAHR